MQTIFPLLRYNDARAAIQWLCTTFGFVELFSVPEAGPVVRDAQLKLGTNIIMIGSVRSDDAISSPRVLGAATQGSMCAWPTWMPIFGMRSRPVPRSRARPKRPILDHVITTCATWRAIRGPLARTFPM